MVIELKAGSARIEVMPEFGGRIHQLWLTIGGEEHPLLWSPADTSEYERRPTYGGCFPMAPWPNRIANATFPWAGREVSLPANDGPNALHGVVADRPWEVVARVGRVVEMRCELDERWPWAGYAWQRIELGDGGLTIKVEVRANREAFPAGLGLHPWFLRDFAGSPQVRVTVPAAERYVMADGLPTGKLAEPAGEFDLRHGEPLAGKRLDDCYTDVGGPAVVKWERLRLEMAMECAEPHVMVHSTDEAFCIEPQTCSPDAFNLRAKGVAGTGFSVAEPGRAVGLVSRWRWQIM
jgi:aldose 1-epimerase